MEKQEVENLDDSIIEMLSSEETISNNKIQIVMLKYQHSHMNKVEEKINKISEDVKNLEKKFDGKIDNLEKKFDKLENRLDSFEEKVESRFEAMENKFEAKIEKAINTQTKWLISGAGVLVISMKLLDIFTK
jgi:uncharacterized protein YlxW (UPF0749 family)